MAEQLPNPILSTDLTVETKVNIDELIYMLNPDDLPMLGGVNTDGFPVVPRQPVDNTEFSWLEDEFLTPRTTLASAYTATGTSLTVASGAGERFAVGDAVRIDDEVFAITAVSNDTLTVTFGAAGTSNVNHASGAEVLGIGTFLSEGSIGDEQFTGRTKYSNYTQIWTSKIQISRTAQRIPKYGIANELARQTRKVMLAEGVNMEQALLYGIKYQSGATRSTGGVSQFVTTNVFNNAASGDWLTVEEVERTQQIAYDAGGQYTAIVSNPANFAALNNLAGAERIQTVTIEDERRGRRRATSVITEFGEVLLVRNRYCRAADAFGINRENLIYRTFQPMVMQPLAKTDDKDNYMFVAEGGFEVKGQRHMARWTGLDNTAALPTDLV
jgi:hypothetical protein